MYIFTADWINLLNVIDYLYGQDKLAKSQLLKFCCNQKECGVINLNRLLWRITIFTLFNDYVYFLSIPFSSCFLVTMCVNLIKDGNKFLAVECEQLHIHTYSTWSPSLRKFMTGLITMINWLHISESVLINLMGIIGIFVIVLCICLCVSYKSCF